MPFIHVLARDSVHYRGSQGARVATLLVTLLMAACGAGHSTADESTGPAIAAATAWLALTDERDYAGSWQAAAPVFKGAVSESQWVKALTGLRTPMGPLQSRTVRSAHYATTLPGAPDGEYVVIQFDSQFAHKAGAVETVTPMKVEGEWRVSGYFIR